MKKVIFFLICILILSNIAVAQKKKLDIKYPLTDQDIEEAIKEGNEKKEFGLTLTDTWKYGNKKGSRGFIITIMTPYSWISYATSEAKRKYMSFTKEDVTEEMLEPSIWIRVTPDMPIRVIASDMASAENVEHVVLADTKKELIIQPSSIEFYDAETQSGTGAVASYKGARVEFSIEDLRKVADRDFKKKGEFYVKVIGEKTEKEFKVKDKHFKHIH